MSAEQPKVDVDICNLALDSLNQNPITSIDTPEDPAAEACARWYHLVRRSLLRQHPWKFATIRKFLASSATYTPPFGYDKAWPLPDDYIRFIGIGDDKTGIITDDAGRLCFRYIYNFTDVSKMDSLFVDMFSINLGLKIAPKFTGSEARVNSLKDDLKKITPASFSVDGQERPPSRIQNSKWMRRRRMNGSRGYGTPYVTFGDKIMSDIGYQLENGYILTGNV